jgi:shikimate kinase
VGVVLVSGLSGVGKSAVYTQLVQRGYEAFGFDEDRFGEWFDRRTGLAVPFPADRRDGDIAHLEFKVHRDKLEELAHRSAARLVYLCGGAGHEFHFWELLDGVIYLSVDDDTLRHRLAARTDNGYGKTDEELAGILHANQTWEGTYRERGATIVDATASLERVVDAVVQAAERFGCLASDS